MTEQQLNELMSEIRAETAHNREFMRELTVRNERVTQQLVSRLDAQTAEFVAGRKVLDDLHEASMDHTRAIANLIDELRRNGLGGRGWRGGWITLLRGAASHPNGVDRL